jgi:NitT/TauT family transport system ATP-binding protein
VNGLSAKTSIEKTTMDAVQAEPTDTIAGAGSLVCRDVRKAYVRDGEDDMVAVDNATFSVAPGEFVALVGPSGCGKSTLLRLIDGLTPVTSGTVEVGGKRVTKPGRDRGFVFQADNLFPWRTVEQNVRFGLEIQGMDKQQREDEVTRLLELAGLLDFRRRHPHELSGGMRQRVNLVRALACDPQVLLMDEPFSALDAQTRELMQAEVLRLWLATKKTVVFVTHSIEEAVFMADRVLLMSSRPGRIRTEYKIDIPRPRDPGVQRTPEFVEISRLIWEDLRSDMTRAFAAETHADEGTNEQD